MNDLDQELREMFHRHETDVIGRGSVSRPILRRVRRRQATTVLTAIVGMAALVLGAFSIRAATGGSRQPADRGSPAPTMTLRGFGIGFSADGTRLLARSMTDQKGFIYDAGTGRLLQTVSGPRGSGLVQASAPDGRTFATATADPATTWINDAATGRASWRFRGACCLGAFGPDGRTFAAPCCGIGTRLYDLRTGRTIKRFPVWGVTAFSPDGRRLVISVGDDEPGNVVGYVWNTDAGVAGRPALTLHGRGGGNVAMASVAWSLDGSMIAVVTGRGDLRTVIVFSARTGERIFTIDPPSSAVSVAFDPESSMVAIGTTDGGASIWDVADPTTPILAFQAHDTEVAAIAFSPDGSRLMTGAWFENETKVWDIKSLSSVESS